MGSIRSKQQNQSGRKTSLNGEDLTPVCGLKKQLEVVGFQERSVQVNSLGDITRVPLPFQPAVSVIPHLELRGHGKVFLPGTTPKL